MTRNVGTIDRVARVVIGLIFLAYAFRSGFRDTGWNWVGFIGVVPILTALIGFCPAYALFRISTCRPN